VVSVSIHNTRLFPKHRGAIAYRNTGIAARCDWVLMTDGGSLMRSADLRGDLSRQPRTVYLSLRSYYDALPCFVNEVLPRIERPFVLVSGSEDITLPRQTDRRSRGYTAEEQALVGRILADERVLHWFMENRDQVLPKTSSLPVGYVFPDGGSTEVQIAPNPVALADRPLRVLCCHRVRDGAQWEPRRSVSALCKGPLADIATVIEEQLEPSAFEAQVRRHPFVLCVPGGGLDPSPKAWQSIACGSIPVIASSTLDDAYRELPVAIVEGWSPEALSPEQLRQWLAELTPWYEDPERRTDVLYRLSIDYWGSRILEPPC